MDVRWGAAWLGLMLVMAGCSANEGAPKPEPAAAAPTAAVTTAPSPTVTAAPTPSAAAPTATPAAATPAAATPAPATAAPASSTPQPSAAAAKPTAAAATAAPVAATAKPTPTPVPTPAPASASPTPSAKPQAADTVSAEAAQALYKDNCMACHGAGLAGDFGPNLTKVGSRKTKEEITQQIVKGKDEMPPFGGSLKAEEIETLAAWLAAKK
ncbi:c-type cytochrome [Paenibacillus sp. GCM10023248]|uniref:c-type cytochrome n=1 Tax=unclassified Paenibacillus TaxID=185978 RepID=UPI0023789F4F|nr:cytochrome c [Paenibacillus sp. MAHUQ-63]MDD9266459.1 cytochrome c [Paenibacillus sp. MAHUQ-63]